MSKQIQVTAPVAGKKKPLTNAERFPSAAKAEAEAAAKKIALAQAKAEGKTVVVEKVKVVQAPFVPKFVKKGAPVHLIAQGSRPGSGRLLYAHTHAALAIFGMFDAKAAPAPKAAVLAFMGQTAVTYHLKERNFSEGPKGISLTVSGRNKFMNRLTDGKFDTKVAMAFQDLFLTGKVDPATHVKQADVFPQKFAAE